MKRRYHDEKANEGGIGCCDGAAMLCGALPAVPGGAELLKAPLTAHAAGSVTLNAQTGVLTVSGAVTKAQIWEYQGNEAVESIVAADDCVLPADCSELFARRY